MLKTKIINKLFMIVGLCGCLFFNNLDSAEAAQYLIVDKGSFTLKVCEQDVVLRKYPIAIGKNLGEKTCVGDHKTPTGKFSVEEIIDSTAWTHDFQDGKGEIAGAYGPYFIALETGWEGIGIHGTHAPESIGTRASEGCVRLYNDDLLELKTNYIYIGMTVIIKE